MFLFSRITTRRFRTGLRAMTTVSSTAVKSCLRFDQNRRLDAWLAAHDAQQRACFSPVTEKVTVQYIGKLGQPCALQMTKGLSTPMDCARHLSSLLAERSAIALVDGHPWSMFHPFVKDCSLEFLHFKDSHNDPTPANDAFWRSASFLLAATLESAFHPAHEVRVISNPVLKPESGGFFCDIAFTPTDSTGPTPWIPSAEELRALSVHGQRLATSNMSFEPLNPTHSLLESCFADHPIRLAEICKELSLVTTTSVDEDPSTPLYEGAVYKMGSFVEASAGPPLISSSRLIGRFAVSSILPLGWLKDHTPESHHPILVYRAQGIALPTAFITHFTTFDRLIHWSREANTEAPKKAAYIVDF
ncbi:hypothetical protein T265_00860 [Opisthorchis viverrini]|uniref:TGS domain-containing protein n=1 Tax=Opisthorchis viverrini TaxID=6198 RepID=A0A075A0G5_OPIVI|nr:hypothetical protein T265_00860 [Opisthorchis viverrini]KER33158.1 hypothetical protein T265_00860 [Opisthorchis viverrini]